MDLEILRWINENLHGSNFVNYLVKFITYLGDGGIIWILTTIVLLCFKKTRRGGLLLGGGLASIAIVNNLILKNIISRPRPFTQDQSLADFITGIGMELPTSTSFPSGHTAVAMMSAIVLTMVFKKKGSWSYIPAVLIALSRLFLCVHYLTDILGGMAVGSIVGVGVVLLGNIILNKLELWWNNRKAKKVDKPIEDESETQSKE